MLHKQAGNPVAVWRDGKVEWMDVEQLEDSEDRTACGASGRGEPLKEERDIFCRDRSSPWPEANYGRAITVAIVTTLVRSLAYGESEPETHS